MLVRAAGTGGRYRCPRTFLVSKRGEVEGFRGGGEGERGVWAPEQEVGGLGWEGVEAWEEGGDGG